MPLSIALMVEGHGEVQAAPLLLRRIFQEVYESFAVSIEKPFRVPRSKICNKSNDFRRAMQFLGMKNPDAIFIIFDSDDDCPVSIAQEVRAAAQAEVVDTPIFVVAAQREYEAWLLAGSAELEIVDKVAYEKLPSSLESVRNPKLLLKKVLASGTYSETVDQSRLTGRFDLELARSLSTSFDKLVRDLGKILG